MKRHHLIARTRLSASIVAIVLSAVLLGLLVQCCGTGSGCDAPESGKTRPEQPQSPLQKTPVTTEPKETEPEVDETVAQEEADPATVKIQESQSRQDILYSPKPNAAAGSARVMGLTANAKGMAMGSSGAHGWMMAAGDAGYMNTEEYSTIDAAGYKMVTVNPLSTFSIDVDTACYSNIRRMIQQGQMPPENAVRIEELINYFSYDYPEPEDEHPFSISTEMGPCPWNEEHRLVHIGIQGRKISMENAPASNLVFLIDVSGSMSPPNKLGLVRKSMQMLTRNLRPQDRVAIVVYAGAAGMVLESTPGSEQEKILDAIENLQSGGSTAGAAGIRLAYETARKHFDPEGNNRVILCTDGDFNVGVSSEAELVGLIEDQCQHGVFLTVLGFGTGNIKDNKMEQLADKGNGNYGYIDNLLEAKKVLVSEMGGTLLTIAKDVKIQVEFNPSVVRAYRLIGYENRALADQDFNDDTKDAGELGAGHTVTALYEIIPAASNEKIPGVDPLKYQRTVTVDENTRETLTVKFRYKKPDGDKSILLSRTLQEYTPSLARTSSNFRFSAAVAGFGMLLRDSEYKGYLSWNRVMEMARQSKGDDREGYRHDFIRLVEQAQLINGR